MKPSKLDKVLAFFMVGALIAAAGFILWSTQASCESALAPAHRMCTD